MPGVVHALFICGVLACRIGHAEAVKYIECGNDPVCEVGDATIFFVELERQVDPRILESRAYLMEHGLWNHETQAVFNEAYIPAIREALRRIILEELMLKSAEQYWTAGDELVFRLLAFIQVSRWPESAKLTGREFRRLRLLSYFDLHAPKDWNASDPVASVVARKEFIREAMKTCKVVGVSAGEKLAIPDTILFGP